MKGKCHFWVRSFPTGDGGSPWWIKPLIRDYPGHMGALSVYGAGLAPGHQPHPIHAHPQEEIEILLNGELELITPEHTTRILAGDCFYHPPGKPHTIRSVGDEPATLFLLRWSSPEQARTPQGTECLVFLHANLECPSSPPSILRQRVCDGLTLANGSRLVVYSVRCAARSGYQLHTDPYDALTVLLAGRFSGYGHDTRAPAVIYYPTGVMHGIAPTSPEPMLAFNFQFYPPTGMP